MMRKYVVVEPVRETLLRERTWKVSAISEHDAIRQVIEGEAAECYRGKDVHLESSKGPVWVVDGQEVEYEQTEAVAIDDDFVDIGGHG